MFAPRNKKGARPFRQLDLRLLATRCSNIFITFSSSFHVLFEWILNLLDDKELLDLLKTIHAHRSGLSDKLI